MTIIRLGGKVRDMGFIQMLDYNEDGDLEYTYDHQGYVPDIEYIGGGDYFDIDIDNETGRVINWKPIKREDLE